MSLDPALVYRTRVFNDTDNPDLGAHLFDANGDLIDLTGKTVLFYARDEDAPWPQWDGPNGSGTMRLNGVSVTVLDASIGKVKYVFSSPGDDLPSGADYDCWFTVDAAVVNPKIKCRAIATTPSAPGSTYQATFDA